MLEPHLHTSAALIAEQPDLTLAELKDGLGTPASLAMIWRAVKAPDINMVRPTEHDRPDVARARPRSHAQRSVADEYVPRGAPCHRPGRAAIARTDATLLHLAPYSPDLILTSTPFRTTVIGLDGPTATSREQ